ncbi:phage portal protein [Alkalihalobacillus sp. LMS39]|uniref:phage portal protein n=1 Tax=Alkalihalobacillus sp. LMS39 TaxID=2924032 RepID=UPI001FB1ACF3|nr:phage portal protein [Alkalihalobacillus sp. LMS39]UOE96068.1 phage portal protein [Alkalihalobacillus sp. LMS39]
MGAFDWFRAWFGSNNTIKLDGYFFELNVKAYYKRLAVESCIDLIANTVSRCEFQTFEKGKEKRGETYYLLNVQPNQNQNATEFIHSLINNLIMNNEVLIIMQDDQLYVADDYSKKEYAFKENVYRDVVIGELKLDKTFLESDVLNIKLNNRNVMNVINSLYEDYGKLLASGINYYKRKNNKRYLIKGDFIRPQDKETQEAIDEMFQGQLKNWFDPDKEGSAFQIQDGYAMEDMSDGQKGNAGNIGTSRDIREMINDIIDFVAMPLHIPRGLIKGDVADVEKLVDSFLMFGIKPIVELVMDEINRKMYTKAQFLERTYMKIDTNQIKVVDITQLASAADKLFAIGFSFNDILALVGRDPIHEEWANKRYVTKNYQDIQSLEGGESE